MIATPAGAAPPSRPSPIVPGRGNLSSVLAAHPFNELGIELRRRGKCLLDCLEPGKASVLFGCATHQRNFAFAPKRPGRVETRLGPRAPSLKRRIHGHAHHSRPDDEIPIRLKACSHRPFDLMMVMTMDPSLEGRRT